MGTDSGMTPERWQRIKQLFDQVLELNSEQRVALLENSVDADRETIQNVLEMLEQYENAGNFLEQPVGNAKQILDEAAAKPAGHRLSPGQRLGGRFVIGEFIAHGGMGEVYKAFDTELASPVAIKTLRNEFAEDREFLDRFRKEVQVARGVRGPHLCEIYDIGRDGEGSDAVVYLWMEYLDGPTLRDVIKKEGPFTPATALPILTQIADGLQSLRAANLVHRDLKPGNVVLEGWGTPKVRAVITDFGLARPVVRADEAASARGSTQTSGRIAGTPDYMAPEQLGRGAITAAADVYAFGIVAYETISGKRPFDGDSLSAALARLHDDPVSPISHVPTLPPVWEQAILRCLTREPEDRPESAMVVAKVLDGELPIKALLPGFSLSRAVPKMTRWEWAAAIAMMILLPVAGWFAARSGGEVALPGKHVAVLPFTAMHEDTQLLAYGDGLMDTLTGRLSQFEQSNRQLVVVPVSEVRRQNVSTPDAAVKRFNVDFVVQGRVDSQGERVRLTLTVIDTRSMRQVGTAVVEETRRNLLNLQDGSVAKLSNLLSLSAVPGSPGSAASAIRISPDAYDYYLQGRGYLQRTDREEDVRMAIELFERSLSHESGYAPSLAGLADAYWFLYERTRDPKWVALARNRAIEALNANSQIADTHITMGRLLNGTGEFRGAVESFKRALELEPRSPEALYGLASAHANRKDFDLAESTHLRAVSYRPSDWYAYKKLGLFYLSTGNLEKAAEAFTNVVKLTPDNFQGYNNLGVAYSKLGRFDEARKHLLKTYELAPRVSSINNIARLEFLQGRYEAALEWSLRSLKMNDENHMTWGNLAAAQTKLGMTAEAAESHRRAIQLVQREMKVNPKSGVLHSFIAHYLAPLGERDAAIANMKKSVELVPNDPDLLEQNAETWISLGDVPEARKVFREAVRSGLRLSSVSKHSRLWPFAEELLRAAPEPSDGR